MTLRFSRLESTQVAKGVNTRPFDPDPRFNDHWWTGTAKGALAFCAMATEVEGEVARAQVNLQPVAAGEAYSTFPLTRTRCTEIDLFEVRPDLRRGGVGRQAVECLVVEFGSPIIAISLDKESDGFWRKVGWTECPHPDGLGRPLFVHLD